MFRQTLVLMRTITTRGSAVTEGNLVYLRGGKMYWFSQRQAAKAMGVSANVLSKHLSGKLPKLYC